MANYFPICRDRISNSNLTIYGVSHATFFLLLECRRANDNKVVPCNKQLYMLYVIKVELISMFGLTSHIKSNI